MKKLLFASLFVSTSIYLLSLAEPVMPDIYEWGPPPYSGPPDDFDITREEFWWYRVDTTFGMNANYSDVIAIGHVVTQDITKLVVHVEIPLVGCTNGQPVTIKLGSYDDPEQELQWLNDSRQPTDLSRWMPTNQARIVFCVISNNVTRTDWFDWDADYEIKNLSYVDSAYRFQESAKRLWWYTDRENGLVLEQFTNIVQAVRLDRNWTNYFHLTRDGMYKDSIRIKEDSFYDMEGIVRSATTNHAYLIYNDPLVLPEHKALFPLWHPYVIK